MTRAAQVLSMMLGLASCAQPPETVQMTPTLHCAAAMFCKIHRWQVGLSPQLAVNAHFDGTYMRCHCYSYHDDPP